MPALLPEDVVQAPELLVLASLEPALHTLPVALVAAYPELPERAGAPARPAARCRRTAAADVRPTPRKVCQPLARRPRARTHTA